jgi:hypothetical protein
MLFTPFPFFPHIMDNLSSYEGVCWHYSFVFMHLILFVFLAVEYFASLLVVPLVN